ncbi:hypothetical protein BDN67DRAFT_971763 [Paxillus ammoniavirescens]|nr:hypothetical protein BDN67DRAFT_971763 [Paxillus ammoniavirescens]
MTVSSSNGAKIGVMKMYMRPGHGIVWLVRKAGASLEPDDSLGILAPELSTRCHSRDHPLALSATTLISDSCAA